MKKLPIFILTIFSIVLRAQIITTSYNSTSFESTMKSTTMIVLLGDTAYDNSIKRAVTKYWKVTKYEFIDVKNIDTKIADETKSFLLPLMITVTWTHEMNSKFDDFSKLKCWLTVINGGKKSIRKYSDNDPIAISPFNYWGDENDYKNCAYRLDYMIKGINDGFEVCKQKQLEGSYPKMVKNSISEINKQTENLLSKKTLVINSSNRISEDVFSDAGYRFKTKFVSDTEFKSILRGNSNDYLCLVPAFEVNKHILIYEPSTRKTVHYGWSMQGMKISKKDIKNFTSPEN